MNGSAFEVPNILNFIFSQAFISSQLDLRLPCVVDLPWQAISLFSRKWGRSTSRGSPEVWEPARRSWPWRTRTKHCAKCDVNFPASPSLALFGFGSFFEQEGG